jgi:hypothetical protein
MDGWWDQIEHEIRDCMKRHSSLTTSELARHLRMSESATESVLRVLAASSDLQMHVRLSRPERHQSPERHQANDAPRNAA